MDIPVAPRPVEAPADLLRAVAGLVPLVRARASSLDREGAFPAEDLADLREAGALAAPLLPSDGGLGFGTTPEGAEHLAALLALVGGASLPLGRLLEGHVNALALVVRYGTQAQRAVSAADARAGLLFGVWNTDDREAPLTVRDGHLEGRKILCSGAGHVARALVTAETGEGRRMLLARLSDPARADLSAWTAQGMRASATGSVGFDGLPITQHDLIGFPGDYERQPWFSSGAWRVLAVFAGGIDCLAEALATHLRDTGRGTDPHQLARAGEVFAARETARLWVREAGRRAEADDPDPDATVAYVDLARGAVETAATDVIRLVQRSVGLPAFMRPHPIERVARDLATYLRQPVPDRALVAAAAYHLSR